MRKITQEEYRLSNWSGGTTTQLLIWPQNADYQSRDFSFRISSATVELEESVFTHLPKVHRFLSILDGELQLIVKHDSEENVVTLKEKEIFEFEGDWEVKSKGQVRDFNLMLKDMAGSMEYIEVNQTRKISCEREFVFFFLVEGNSTILKQGEKDTVELSEGESMFDQVNQKSEYLLQTEQQASIFLIQAGEYRNA